MALLTWNHTCSVGVRAMDDQHGVLMDAINELRLALVRGSGHERIRELLDQFIEFTRMHFWSEEQLMVQTGFAGLEEHRAEHHRMLAEILRLRTGCNTARRFICAPCCANCAMGFSSTSSISTRSTVRGSASAASADFFAGVRLIGRQAARRQLSKESCAVAHTGAEGFGSEASS